MRAVVVLVALAVLGETKLPSFNKKATLMH
jgi:Sec-independent protein translocase protein TatA